MYCSRSSNVGHLNLAPWVARSFVRFPARCPSSPWNPHRAVQRTDRGSVRISSRPRMPCCCWLVRAPPRRALAQSSSSSPARASHAPAFHLRCRLFGFPRFPKFAFFSRVLFFCLKSWVVEGILLLQLLLLLLLLLFYVEAASFVLHICRSLSTTRGCGVSSSLFPAAFFWSIFFPSCCFALCGG